MKFNYKNKGHVPLCNLEAMKTTALHLTLTVSYHDNTPYRVCSSILFHPICLYLAASIAREGSGSPYWRKKNLHSVVVE